MALTAHKTGQAAVLTVNNLAISFPFGSGSLNVVTEVSFAIRAGETMALVGESGSGKSLTALSILGLVPKPGRISAGEIRLDGKSLVGLPEREMRDLRGRSIGMIFQEPMTSLNPVYTVGFHLAEALGGKDQLGREELKRRSVELLAEVGIPEPEARLASYPHELSGGMRQRVMISCAMARNPRLLIADEPTTALDVTVEAQIMRLIAWLKATRNAAVLLVTHDLGLVAQHADSVAVIYAGYVVELSNVTDLFADPLHPYTRALLKALPATRPGAKLTPIPGNVPEPSQLPSGCPFRDRCELAVAKCALAVPTLEPLGAGRWVRCIRVCLDG